MDIHDTKMKVFGNRLPNPKNEMTFRVSTVKFQNSRVNSVVGSNKHHPICLEKDDISKGNMFHHPSTSTAQLFQQV